MMMAPEMFYTERLQGKSVAEIKSVIRSLKREMARLKNMMEHPNYKSTMLPSEDTRLSMARDYLERAKQALVEAGGTYTPTKAEEKVATFDESLQNISKIEFSLVSFGCGIEARTYTFEGETVHVDVLHALFSDPADWDDITEWDRDELLSELKELHIGEWRRRYDISRFGFLMLDGESWQLTIHYRNAKRAVNIKGENSYPYNFGRLLELFGVEMPDN